MEKRGVIDGQHTPQNESQQTKSAKSLNDDLAARLAESAKSREDKHRNSPQS